MQQPELSIVVPVHNERDNVTPEFGGGDTGGGGFQMAGTGGAG